MNVNLKIFFTFATPVSVHYVLIKIFSWFGYTERCSFF